VDEPRLSVSPLVAACRGAGAASSCSLGSGPGACDRTVGSDPSVRKRAWVGTVHRGGRRRLRAPT